MARTLIFIVCGIIAWWVFSTPDSDAVVLPDGSYQFPGFTISNPEAFELEARVLSREDYRLDAGATLSPTDLALGWGEMADEAVFTRIDISQGGRWYRWRSDDYPIPKSRIIAQSANMHMVPANELVARELERVKRHDMIRLTGKLVDIYGENGWRWRSSRSRTDTGNGSCELLLLERIVWL
ncbi:MAG: hypothetical protein AB7I04_17470 [Pseudomonadales bacterium]